MKRPRSISGFGSAASRSTSGFTAKRKRKTEDEKSSPIQSLVADATATAPGKRAPASETLFEIKRILKRGGEAAAAEVFAALFQQMEADNSQIRLLAAVVMDCLFRRSHWVRRSLSAKLRHFILFCGGNGSTIPGPEGYRQELRTRSVAMVTEWDRDFGGLYPELRVARRYLAEHRLHACPVEPRPQTIPVSQGQSSDAAQQARRLSAFRRAYLKAVDQGGLDRIEAVLREAEEGARVFIPTPEDELEWRGGANAGLAGRHPRPSDAPEKPAPESDDEEGDSDLEWEAGDASAVHGDQPELNRSRDDGGSLNTTVAAAALGSDAYELELDLSIQTVVPPSDAVPDSLRDNIRLLRGRYLSMMRDWLQDAVAGERHTSGTDREQCRNLVLNVIGSMWVEQGCQ